MKAPLERLVVNELRRLKHEAYGTRDWVRSNCYVMDRCETENAILEWAQTMEFRVDDGQLDGPNLYDDLLRVLIDIHDKRNELVESVSRWTEMTGDDPISVVETAGETYRRKVSD